MTVRVLKNKTLTVMSINVSSVAYTSGLRRGDIITHVDNIPAQTFSNGHEFALCVFENQNRLAYSSDKRQKSQNLNALEQRRRSNYENLNIEWDYDKPCPYCGFVFYKGASAEFRGYCCLKGRAKDIMPNLNPLPLYLSRRVTDPTLAKHFALSASIYNNQLALAATKVDNGKGGGWEHIYGPHAVRLCGRTHHFFSSPLSTGLQYFTFDALPHARNVFANEGTCTMIKERFLREFYDGLKETNKLVQECEQIGRFASNLETYQSPREVHISMDNPCHEFEVACVVGEDPGELKLDYFLKSDNLQRSIATTHRLYEPLSYPLLFPYGEDGWSAQLNRDYKLTLLKYLRCRMLMPEPNLFVPNQDETKMLNINRFQLMPRLGQTYLVDNFSRIIDMQLMYHKNHLQPNAKDIHDPTVTKTFLGTSFFGSRRHLREQAQNALTIVSELGPPTLFITLTCNPKWPEIMERLSDTDSAYSRADITCMVFHEKLTKVLHNIRHGKYFNLPHGLDYEIRVIEYQYRGLPHCHLVIRDPSAPPKSDITAVQRYIDRTIAACFPSDLNSNPKYVELIREKMLHKCSSGVNGCLNDDNSCDARYDRTVCSLFSTIGEDGFPQYRRPLERDLMVVPHNKKLLEDWQGHANVEYC